MLLLIVLALVALIAFFHYVQGFFSATLSAILCIISAVVAFGFHEPLVKLLGGKLADYAHAVVLVGVFAILYIGLRYLFDTYIPGNLTMPLLVDKVGAALMGLVAGVFAVGIAIIGAQMLPFGPSIGGYARYAVADGGEVAVANSKGQTAPIISALQNEKFNTPSSTVFSEVPTSGLLIPVDDIVVNLVKRISDGGALGAAQPLAAVHPDYLGELFFQRLGIQPGVKRVAVNTTAAQQVTFRPPLYSPASPLQVKDAEPSRATKIAVPKAPLTSKPDSMLLIARVGMEAETADADVFVRVSPASVRLVVNGKNFIPIGTLDQLASPVPTVLLNKADDFLICQSGSVIDFVFQVPPGDIMPDADLKKTPLTVKSEAFIEVKRMGFALLQGVEIKRDAMPPVPDKSLLRKYAPRVVPKVIPVPADGSAAPAATDAPIESVSPPKVDANFIMPISVGPLSSDSQAVKVTDVTGTLRGRKFAVLEISGGRNVDELGQGDVQIKELAAPEGKKIVQLTAQSRAADRKEWIAKLAQTELADADGGLHKVNGAWGKTKSGDGNDRLVASYNADAPITAIPASENAAAEIGLIFVVPSGAKLTELRIDGKRVASVDLTVP